MTGHASARAKHANFQGDARSALTTASAPRAFQGIAEGQPDIVRRVLSVLEQTWRQPDEGIWEVHGPRRYFTYSKVMAWTAFDRAVQLRRSPPVSWRR